MTALPSRLSSQADSSDLRGGGGPIAAVIQSVWLPFALVMVVVFLLYFPIRTFEYCIIDDSSNVYANRYICHLNSQNIGYLWRHTYYDLYMPLTDTIWAVLARIDPLKTPIVLIRQNESTYLNPAVFHLASIGFHLAATAVVFAILRRLRFTTWSCAAGALLFGAHPLQVQSVAWITGMNNLTSGFFSFLAIYFYLNYAGVPAGDAPRGDAPRTPAFRYAFLALSTLSFAAALLSKPNSVVLPLFVIILETLMLRRPARRWVGTVGFWLLLSLVCVQVTRAASEEASSSVWVPFWGRPFIAGDALAFYLGKLAIPYNLTFDYSRNPHAILYSWWGYVTWILPASLFAGFWMALRSPARLSPQMLKATRFAAAGMLIFVAGLLPTLGFIPFYSEVVSTVSDRYVYLAMIGISIAVASVLSEWAPRRKSLVAIPIVLLAVYTSLTSLQIPVWSNMNSLTNDMLASAPNSAVAHQCYGIVLIKRGNWSDALTEFRKSERMQTGVNGAVEDAIGECLYYLKRYDEAIAHYKEAIRRQPDDSNAWFELWLVYTFRGRLKEAEAYCREQIAKHPNDERAKYTIGLILMQQNRPADALPYIELGAKDEPESGDNQFYVGVVLQKLGRFAEAARYYKRALELDPGNADAAKGLASLPAETMR